MDIQHLMPGIIERGRGPEIEGTRITVYDVFDYHRVGWHHTQIATLFRLSSRQIIQAIDYIEAHRAEVERVYERIMERHRRGNPPEIMAKLAQSRKKLMERLRQLGATEALEQLQQLENRERPEDAHAEPGVRR